MKTELTRNDTFGERLVEMGGQRGLREVMRTEVRAPSDAPPDEPVLEFIASDETIDRYNEVIRVDGWQLENYRKNPVILDSHNYWSVSSILGDAPLVEVRDGKLINRVRFALENPLGRIAYGMAKAGFIHTQSVGFIPLEWNEGKSGDEWDREFVQQELLEISLVAVPANPNAIGLALKSGAVKRVDVEELLEVLRRAVGTSNIQHSTSNVEEEFKEFCRKKAGMENDSGAKVTHPDVAQLLQLARAVAGRQGAI